MKPNSLRSQWVSSHYLPPPSTSSSASCYNHHHGSFTPRSAATPTPHHVSSSSSSTSCFKKMVQRLGSSYLTEPWERKYYADRYTCCPPPIFIPFITLIELGTFLFLAYDSNLDITSGQVPEDSFLIYRPDRKEEVWRFLTYMFVHAGWIHLVFNLMVQLLIGLPLEMVHGSTRLATIYLSGVLAGSLGTSVFDGNCMLVGASGGVYALLAAHLANVILNYHQMEMGILRIIGVFMIASADVGFAVYDRYSKDGTQNPVSYVAHLTGALSGLTLGLVVLKNFEQKLREQLIWWIALGIYISALLFAILYNIFN